MPDSAPLKATTAGPPFPAGGILRQRDTLLRTLRSERWFLVLLGVAVTAAGASADAPAVARWVGFMLAAYATVANDSIQTLGTFLASNRRRPWWVLWGFVASVFLVTVTLGWLTHAGDVTYGRLAAKGFETAPTAFTPMQVGAPIILLILTRLRMPVSTTFLILSCFAAEAATIGAVLQKSLVGYAAAFGLGALVWGFTAHALARHAASPPHPFWVPAQWLSTGVLWASWVMQDAANLAVFLPRALSAAEFAAFAGTVVIGLGVLLFLRGDRIQRVVEEKTATVDIRAATMIDLIYAALLFGFVRLSPVPMSTTWVFLGLLAGRELALVARGASAYGWRSGLRLVGRDLLFAGIGLAVSVIVAIAANSALR